MAMTKEQKTRMSTALVSLGLAGAAIALFVYIAKSAQGASANGFTLKLKNVPAGATQWMFDLGAISFDPAIQPYLPHHTLRVNETFTFNTTVPIGALMHLFVGSDAAILVEAFKLAVENGKAYEFNCLTLQLETL